MKLAVFGATGGTGRLLVEQALAAGHKVTVLARDPSKLGTDDPKLRVVKGSLAESDRIEEIVAGAGGFGPAEAVISALGPRGNNPAMEISQGMEKIVAAMKQCGVKRLVMTAAMGIPAPQDQPNIINKAISSLLTMAAKNVAADMGRAVAIVQSSELDWTVLRVPRLTNKPGGRPLKFGYVGKRLGFELSRADLAKALLDAATQGQYVHEMPGVSN